RDEKIRPSGRGRARLQARVDGNDREVAAADIERDNLNSRAAGVHLSFIERVRARILVNRTGAEREHVRRHVETVRPNAELRIITEEVGHLTRIEAPATRYRIASLRSG